MKTTSTIKKAQALLDKYGKLKAETDRHKKMADKLEAEEKAILPKLDLQKIEDFERLSFLRTKRDLLPHRIKAYNTEMEGVLEELNEEFDNLLPDHRESLANAKKLLIEKIAAPLAPFFPKETELEKAAMRRLASMKQEWFVPELQHNTSSIIPLRAAFYVNNQADLSAAILWKLQEMSGFGN